jgi:hypothetical protein
MWYFICLMIGVILGFLGRYCLVEVKCRDCGTEFLEYP